MSPRSPDAGPTLAVLKGVSAICHALGDRIRSERRRRRWTMAQLAVRAGVSTSAIHALETGERGSLEIHVRIARALGLELRMELVDPRHHFPGPSGTDLVHAGMGEVEVAHLRGLGYGVGVDEPYQHFQFAGRADVVAWDLDHRALLHIENRTRFPDIQAAAGAFNAKRDHLAASIAHRLGIGRFASQTHVMVGLWSAEVLHTLRLRPATFLALCPDPPDEFEAWWRGDPPRTGRTSQMILLDPFAEGRQRRYIALADALHGARPRIRGYAEAAARVRVGTR